MAITEENYISLKKVELSTCKDIGHEYFLESIYLVNHKTLQICESAVLSPDVVSYNCEFNFIYNKAPNAAIVDAGDTLLLSKLDKPWYLKCNECNNVPVYDYTVINRFLLCDCQLQGKNEF